ncbi:MAG: methyl-accepting chemotaxis protein [Chloroflexota bacterium]
MGHTPDRNDLENQIKARSLRILLFGFGAFAVIGLMVALVLSLPVLVIGIETVLLLLLALCYGLLRRERLALASVLFLGCWIVFSMAPLLSAATSPFYFYVAPYIVLPAIVVAGALLAPQSAFLAALLMVMLALAAIILRGGWGALDAAPPQGGFLAVPLAISALMAAISWLFGGNVRHTVKTASDDAQALAVQLANNESLIAQVIRSASRLASLTDQMALTLEQTSSSAEQIAATTSQMAQGTTAQAEQAERASYATARLAEATRRIALNTHQVDKASDTTQKLSLETARVIQELNDRLTTIDQVVALVDDIADQTDLLALNASIEAARAGEHGRGFAVVAAEVRRLAEHSAQSMETIGRLSREVQNKLQDVFSATGQMQSGSSQTRALVQQVVGMTQDQETAADAMVEAVNSMAAVAEENAVATEQIATAVEGQTTAIVHLAGSAQVLTEVVDGLQGIVSRFTATSGSVCPNLAACPVFANLYSVATDASYIDRYCMSDYVACSRKRLKDAGEPVPLTLLPDGSHAIR